VKQVNNFMIVPALPFFICHDMMNRLMHKSHDSTNEDLHKKSEEPAGPRLGHWH
jgi:hypothetical protein